MAVMAMMLVTAPAARAQSLGPAGCQLGASLICAAHGATGLVGGAAKQGLGLASDAVMDGIVDWAAGGATWLLRTIGRQVDRSSRPQIASAWFSQRYAATRDISVVLCLGFLLVSIAQAALRHDLQLLLRCGFVALPAAVLLMFAAVTLVEIGLAVTDELSSAVLAGSGSDVHHAFADLGTVLKPASGGDPTIPGFPIFVAAVLTALLALLVWMELVLREAAVYLAVAFLPLALSAAVWPRTAHWSQRLGGWLGALVLAKLTIATAFSLAGAMLAGGRPGSGGLSALLAGCAVLVLAAASPWVLLRLIPFTSETGLHRGDVTSSVSQAPGGAAGLLVARQRGLGRLASSASAGDDRAQSAPWAPAAARELVEQ